MAHAHEVDRGDAHDAVDDVETGTGREQRQVAGREADRHGEAHRARRVAAAADLVRCPLRDDPALVDDEDAVGQALRLVEVVGREEQRHAAADQPVDEVPRDAAG